MTWLTSEEKSALKAQLVAAARRVLLIVLSALLLGESPPVEVARAALLGL